MENWTVTGTVKFGKIPIFLTGTASDNFLHLLSSLIPIRSKKFRSRNPIYNLWVPVPVLIKTIIPSMVIRPKRRPAETATPALPYSRTQRGCYFNIIGSVWPLQIIDDWQITKIASCTGTVPVTNSCVYCPKLHISAIFLAFLVLLPLKWSRWCLHN